MQPSLRSGVEDPVGRDRELIHLNATWPAERSENAIRFGKNVASSGQKIRLTGRKHLNDFFLSSWKGRACRFGPPVAGPRKPVVANKHARLIWVLLTRDEPLRAHAAVN